MPLLNSFKPRKGDEEGSFLDRVKIKDCSPPEDGLNGLTAWVRAQTLQEGEIIYILEIIYNRRINKGDVLYARLPADNLEAFSPSYSYKQERTF